MNARLTTLLAAMLFPSIHSLLSAQDTATQPVDKAGLDFFEAKIRPVLIAHCYECHSAEAKNVKGGLLLDSREAAHKGGDSGPAVVPKDVDESLLIGALKYDGFEMPPKGKLPDAVIADFVKWVKWEHPILAMAKLRKARSTLTKRASTGRISRSLRLNCRPFNALIGRQTTSITSRWRRWKNSSCNLWTKRASEN